MAIRASCLLVFLATLVVGTPADGATNGTELETWIDRELTPYLATQFSSHPRFRNQTLRLVVMKDSNPQAVTSALALSLRDRLQDALMDTPGIRIAWRPDSQVPGRIPGSGNVDCMADEAHYLVGLEFAEKRAGEFELSLRALDLEDRSWVAGFGKSWSGALTASQHRLWREAGTDNSFLGERDAPFEASQTDLLAAQLAHKLGCSLLQQVAGEYVATPVSGESGHMLELVANNLAAYNALRLTQDGADANAAIEAKAHKIEDELFQYWITVRPTASPSELTSISASAYVYLQEPFLAVELLSPAVTPVIGHRGAVLSDLRLVELKDAQNCSRYRECFALQIQSSEDAIVFFLNHQLKRGLLRLSSERCEQRASARVMRANEPVRFSLPGDELGEGAWLPADDWELDPAMDTYYAVAANDNKAARALARHIERLPVRCSASLRSGLQGEQLAGWLRELDAIAKHWQTQIDWQLIRVRNVY